MTATLPFGLLLASIPLAQEPARLTAEHVEALEWRNIGPANMGGRIIDLAVHPERPRIFYAASATGGLFKTTNNATTFEAVFENEGSSSVGAVALAPSAPDTVWVGTGEANPRNSVSWGNGVYRSNDGGATWTHRGLEDTRHIGAIAVHPAHADVAFVAAMGSTWGESASRGLFRTRDGGASWERVLFVDERTGCIDVRIDPTRPEIVFAATYERQRDEFDSNDPAVRTGPGSGLWRSLDGGDSWTRLGGGLPTVPMGRIGIDVWAKDPRVLFAIIETERSGERGAPPRSEDKVSLGIRGRDAEAGGFLVERVTPGESAAQAGLESGDVITRVDDREIDGRGALIAALADYAPGASAELVFLRGGDEQTATLGLLGRLQRGRARSFAGSQGGQIGNAQGEQGPEGFESGGVFRSDDRGTTWTRVNSLNPRPFYYSQIRVDPTDERRLYVLGIALHRSTDGGERFDVTGRTTHADHHAMWIDPDDPEHVILGNDGGVYETWDDSATWAHHDVLSISQFYNVAVDDRMPYWVYGGLQDNGSWGAPSATRSGGIATDDWIKINGGDGFRCAVDPNDPNVVYSESQNGAILRLNLLTGERQRVTRAGNRGLRFNWNTPFLLSPHNSSILFYAGNVVFRSIDRGTTSHEISPGITRTDRGSATALAQSALDEDLLWVGSDDGALWATRNGGTDWIDLSDKLPEVPGPRYVSDIEPSPHRARTVYATLDGHRSDDFAAHVFESTDGGDSWRSITSDLPAVPVRTIAVDASHEGLLFVGTETGVFVTIDGGEHWTPFVSGLPTVPVHDLVIHPRAADLIAATHGRGVWIADILPLQSLDANVLASGPFLFPIAPVRRWNSPPTRETSGSRRFVGTNPPAGAAIYYYLDEDRDEPVTLTVKDALGRELRRLEGATAAGLHVARWNLRGQNRQARGGARQRGRGGFGGASVDVGDYSVTLEIGGEEPIRGLRLLPDPLVATREELTTRR
ncbi:MAG: PDZ domain-containing protein [bacterium]|nr:PDZ domain-containing protein [bacterium]